MKSPFDVWIMYLRLKLHFSGTLGYFDYDGAPKGMSIDAYRKRHDRHFFERIWEEYGTDSKRFLLSSFVALKRSPSELYVHEMLEDVHYEEQWKRFQKVENGLSKSFQTDLQKLIRKDKQKSLKNCIRPAGSSLPLLLRRVHSFDFNIESYVILNKVVKVNGLYQKEYTIDPRTGRLCSIAESYAPFIQIDERKVKQIIQEVSELESN